MSSARSVAAKMATVTKDLPIKMSRVAKLEKDGSNFQRWELDIMSYISFIPDVVRDFNGEHMPDDDNLREIHSPFDRIEELRKQFSSVSYAARQAILDQIVATRYDSMKTTIDLHINEMRSLRDKLQQAGTTLPDNVEALLLARSMPAGFPDISVNFEASILANFSHVATTSDSKRALTAAYTGYDDTASSGQRITRRGSHNGLMWNLRVLRPSS
ncbi:hypothetical protein CROQUDRAFT_89068 [Cronartium quercuum f. sp. fusiforme G11]|uniref:Uncharacterized protein n=1 Tax=Cronartium quercuum f. sp. fusiforme G11 TaxID=708437 RepID=A0A9P6TF86_9BASI|nr:hypothetical protein CROQUDRAFT_89068 [Cronartium quercuum f. sp. fusiforme G11]